MDQSQASILEALKEYHRLDRYGFTPPGHRQGRGADPRALETLGGDTFRSDVLSTAGLDDRKSSNGYLNTAEQLMAEAVGADKAFFSTCGSSLSVKASILAVTQGKGDRVLMDVSELGISGYQAADWLRAECRVDVGLNDHRRIEATLSQADNEETTGRLLESLQRLVDAAPELPKPKTVQLPEWKDLEADAVMLPRDAFFGPVENVPFEEAAGRIAAEQITPYPPGIPAVLPGERINQPVLDYLRSGVEAGMVLPDPADPSLQSVRVVAQQRDS